MIRSSLSVANAVSPSRHKSPTHLSPGLLPKPPPTPSPSATLSRSHSPSQSPTWGSGRLVNFEPNHGPSHSGPLSRTSPASHATAFLETLTGMGKSAGLCLNGRELTGACKRHCNGGFWRLEKRLGAEFEFSRLPNARAVGASCEWVGWNRTLYGIGLAFPSLQAHA